MFLSLTVIRRSIRPRPENMAAAPHLHGHARFLRCRRWSRSSGRGHEVVAVYTRAPQACPERGMAPAPSPVEAPRPCRCGFRCCPARRRCEDRRWKAAFRAHGADAGPWWLRIGLILPKPILAAVPLGCFNLHASLLPRWARCRPDQSRPSWPGTPKTGVRGDEDGGGGSITGPIAMAEKVPIGLDATAGELHDRARPARRRPHGARALGAPRTRLVAPAAAAGNRRCLCGQDRARRKPASIGGGHGARSMIISAGLAPFPGAWF